MLKLVSRKRCCKKRRRSIERIYCLQDAYLICHIINNEKKCPTVMQVGGVYSVGASIQGYDGHSTI